MIYRVYLVFRVQVRGGGCRCSLAENNDLAALPQFENTSVVALSVYLV